MKRENEKLLAGGIGYTTRSICMPAGVPGFMMFVEAPVHFIQSPKEVVMIYVGQRADLPRLPQHPPFTGSGVIVVRESVAIMRVTHGCQNALLQSFVLKALESAKRSPTFGDGGASEVMMFVIAGRRSKVDRAQTIAPRCCPAPLLRRSREGRGFACPIAQLLGCLT
jgi:hypothetical protein